MFFPIGDHNIHKGSAPVLTYFFLALNCAVFVFQWMMPHSLQIRFVHTYGSIPIEIIHLTDLHTLVTSMFLHGGWMHLIGNMMFLWVFADNIEATIGSFKFLIFYIGGGVFAALVHTFFNPFSQIPCVGASGAIAACLGAYIVMFPHSRIKILFVLFLTVFRVPAFFFLGFWILQQFLSGIGTIGTVTSDTSGVAYWAHIGGFVFGVISGFLFRSRAKEMTLVDRR
jgi:membrane associated rhomboid family serine protease